MRSNARDCILSRFAATSRCKVDLFFVCIGPSLALFGIRFCFSPELTFCPFSPRQRSGALAYATSGNSMCQRAVSQGTVLALKRHKTFDDRVRGLRQVHELLIVLMRFET